MASQLIVLWPQLTGELPLAWGLSRALADSHLAGKRRLEGWLRRERALGQEARRIRLWGRLGLNWPVCEALGRLSS